MKRILSLILGCGLLACTAVNADAVLISDPLPSSTYITYNGLDWAWASPVASASWGSNILMTPDFHQGWRYATNAEWASRPTADAFLTIPGNTASAKNAVAYWNTYYTHLDYSDAFYGYVTSFPNGSSNETWYVRDSGVPVPTPEPSTFLLLGSSLIGVAAYRKKIAGLLKKD